MVRFTNAVLSGLLAGVLVLAMLSIAFWGFVLMGLRDALRWIVQRPKPDQTDSYRAWISYMNEP